MKLSDIEFKEPVAKVGNQRGMWRKARSGENGCLAIEWHQDAHAVSLTTEQGTVYAPWAAVKWCVAALSLSTGEARVTISSDKDSLPRTVSKPAKRGPGRPRKVEQ